MNDEEQPTHKELARLIISGFERNDVDHVTMQDKQNAFQEVLDGKGLDHGLRAQVLLNTRDMAAFKRLTWMFIAALIGIMVEIAIGSAILLARVGSH